MAHRVYLTDPLYTCLGQFESVGKQASNVEIVHNVTNSGLLQPSRALNVFDLASLRLSE